MTLDTRRKMAENLVLAIPTGTFSEDIFAQDFGVWTANSGDIPGDVFRKRVGVVGAVFPDGLVMTVDGTTAEGARVAVQAHAEGVTFTGKEYKQHYHFLVEFDDQNQVRHLREYANTAIVIDILYPAMKEWLGD